MSNKLRAKSLLVTGGAGFIGSAFVRYLAKKGYCPAVVDKLTYAGSLEKLSGVKDKIRFYKADICKAKELEAVFTREKPEVIVNFAAQTHVDRSIKNPRPFIETNVLGTQVLANISLRYSVKKFIHISTDEVYGEIKRGSFSEDSPLRANSPYAASKAAADLFIQAAIRTYGLPAVIIRPCNNYGPWQYPEKLIPVVIKQAISNKKVPVYGAGLNKREWLYVEDCAVGIFLVMKKGKTGDIFNIGSGENKANIDTVKAILSALDKAHSLIAFVQDRPGHDFRYALASERIKKLGWEPKTDFRSGIRKTIDWYQKNSASLKK